jgi:8-oxo-dGTP diphosphatase
MITSLLQKPILIIIVMILIFNLTQRKTLPRGEKKRFATLYLTGLFLLLFIEIRLIVVFQIGDSFLYPAGAIVFLLALFFRKQLFPYRFRCSRCGRRLPIKQILYSDDYVCGNCTKEPHTVIDASSMVKDINWKQWKPKEDAVLCFIVSAGKIMLIHKKTGLGKGKINGPGGRIEPNESPKNAAIRETEEEIGLTPLHPELVAELSFIFTDGYSLHGYVFMTSDYTGTPIETREAKPFWQNLDAIPYDKMWADDRLWLPKTLGGKMIRGKFIFDGDTIVSHEIEETGTHTALNN